MLDIAKNYLDLGLAVLPAGKDAKRPVVNSWKEFQGRLPTDVEIDAWFSNACDGVCVITGKVSGNLEVIDFDNKGELFEAWKEQVPEKLFDKLVIERTPSGGYHAVYRCESEICGNLKLAQRKTDKVQTLIETRGEGGLFLCAPTGGYEFIGNGFDGLSVISESDRETLLEAAWGLNEYVPEPVRHSEHQRQYDGLRPGDDYNLRGNVREILTGSGWVYAGTGGDNEKWRRPGKTKGWSATLRKSDSCFYVFSSNAAPFDSSQAYSAFAVFTLLECDGDYRSATRKLVEMGFGDKAIVAETGDVDLSGILGNAADNEPVLEAASDPGYLPVELMRIPGFVSELMDFCMETAPYPNQGLAFCGALAMQSFLCGRKIRDAGNLRTNLYLLALAGSSSGKDWPRQINAHLMMQLGQVDCLGDKFASGEGIQDAMNLTPSMLFQNDEIDGLLIAMNKSRDGRLESVMGTLLTMYTSSGSVYAMRRKAGKEKGSYINQPHLTLLGTATPKYYYESLNERMLSNGLFARMIVVDIGTRGKGQDAGLIDLMPDSILETAKYWQEFNPSKMGGNLFDVNPQPRVVNAIGKAKEILNDYRQAADGEYVKAETKLDEAAKAIWGRANENARKLALLYAASAFPRNPEITAEAARWAVRFVDHQIRRMLFLASAHVSENEFDANCLKVIEKLRKSPSGQLNHSVLLKRMKMDRDRFMKIIDTLIDRRDIKIMPMDQVTKKGNVYVLGG